METYKLVLFITGQTLRSKLAVDNIKMLCDRFLMGDYELMVIDVLERPNLAESLKIIATPTLIKERPPPVRRLVGDMTDTAKVRYGLDLIMENDQKEG